MGRKDVNKSKRRAAREMLDRITMTCQGSWVGEGGTSNRPRPGKDQASTSSWEISCSHAHAAASFITQLCGSTRRGESAETDELTIPVKSSLVEWQVLA
jgi:hypothetical protein